jgi:hypothetical protein
MIMKCQRNLITKTQQRGLYSISSVASNNESFEKYLFTDVTHEQFYPVCRAEHRRFRRGLPKGQESLWQPSAKARSTGQIGRIGDLHALHPKGEAQGCAE